MAQNITPESLISILAAALAQKPTKPLVLALDGRCGSGKTTLADGLARQFPASIVLHTDDFYLPPAQRVRGWEKTPCANMDLIRLRDEALRPAYEGQPVLYRAYSCRAGAYQPVQDSRWSFWRAATATTRCWPGMRPCRSSSPAQEKSRPAACRRGRVSGTPILPPGGFRWKRATLPSTALRKRQILRWIRPQPMPAQERCADECKKGTVMNCAPVASLSSKSANKKDGYSAASQVL